MQEQTKRNDRSSSIISFDGKVWVIHPWSWTTRVTFNEQREIEKAIGDINHMDYADAIEKLRATQQNDRLIKVVERAADEAGCTGMVPASYKTERRMYYRIDANL